MICYVVFLNIINLKIVKKKNSLCFFLVPKAKWWTRYRHSKCLYLDDKRWYDLLTYDQLTAEGKALTWSSGHRTE